MEADLWTECGAEQAPRVRTIDADIRWNYLEWGDDGPVLVLWHGITSSAGSWWRVGPALARRGYHVLAPDLPGHGESGDAPSGYAVAKTAGLLDGWMEALGLREPIIAGHSWGGMNALAHSALPDCRVPGRVYILFDPALRIADDPSPHVPLFLNGVGTPDDAGSRAEIAAANPRWHGCDVAWKAYARHTMRPAAVEGFFFENAGADMVPVLSRLERPALLMLADPAAGGLVQSEALPGLRAVLASMTVLRVIDQAGHNIHRDSYESFMASLSAFLDDLPPA